MHFYLQVEDGGLGPNCSRKLTEEKAEEKEEKSESQYDTIDINDCQGRPSVTGQASGDFDITAV